MSVIVYIPSSNKVVLSRDVQFQERIRECEEQVKLPLEDVKYKNQDQTEDTETDKEVYSEEDDDGMQSKEDDYDDQPEEKLKTSERNFRIGQNLENPDILRITQ